MLLLIAMAQAAASSVPPHTIDLTIPKPCATQGSTDADVIVCGRDRDSSSRYRIPPPTAYQKKSGLPKAEYHLGKGTILSAETEQVDIGGTPSNRAMIRFKFKF